MNRHKKKHNNIPTTNKTNTTHTKSHTIENTKSWKHKTTTTNTIQTHQTIIKNRNANTIKNTIEKKGYKKHNIKKTQTQ